MFLVTVVYHSMHAQIYQTVEPVGYSRLQNPAHALRRKLHEDTKIIGTQMVVVWMQIVQMTTTTMRTMMIPIQISTI